MDTTRREPLMPTGTTPDGSGAMNSGLSDATVQAKSPTRIKGKTIVPGIVKGEAIVSQMPISFTGGMNPNTGEIREPGHDLLGKSLAGKVLIFPVGKGSTTGAWQFYIAYKNGVAPRGIINVKAEGVVAAAAVITNTPMIHMLERNPLEIIKTGDTVIINGDEGFVEIIPA